MGSKTRLLGDASNRRRRGCAEDGSDSCADFPDFVGGDCIRREYEFASSRYVCSLDLVNLVFCPSLFFGDGAGEAGSFDEDHGRYVYRLVVKPGWFLFTTSYGGFFTLLGLPSSGARELLVALEASDSLCLGDVMAGDHLFWPGRSAVTKVC
jgi:hypothetical protein